MQNKYNKIMEYVKKSIKESELKAGDKVTSVRKIANHFKCSTSTVIHAFEELKRENVIFSIPQSGYYVVEKDNINNKEKSISDFSSVCPGESIVQKPEDDNTIDFSSVYPNPTIISNLDFGQCITHAIKIHKDSLYEYSDIKGFFALRKALQKHLAGYQVFADTDNIFITSGVQQALFILACMPFPNGKKNVLIEQPTYFGMKRVLELNNVTALGIERDKEGIDLGTLERYFRNDDIKFFYTMPRFHNPTGYSYTKSQKKDILKLAEKYDVYIVEDDYLADLELDSKSDPLISHDLSNRVVYLKSFSKTVLPGLRIGLAVMPKVLYNVFKEYKACCDITTNVLSQGALEVFIKSGMYDTHIKQIRKHFLKQMDTLRKACNLYLPTECKASIPRTGVFTCIELPPSTNARLFSMKLHSESIYLTDIEDLFLQDYRKSNIVRLSLYRVNNEKILKGIRTISCVIKDSIGRIPSRTKYDGSILF
ncbi:MAG: PLP-dependent aminotransferase family protein [Clostridia bacterium]|nr:PLP-dependent aminotransferase family protein [Clostridia bacterium]